jgi:alpha/beta superfamily hydrolase
MNFTPPPPLPVASRTSAAAKWSLGLALLGAFFCLPSIAGFICGIVALARIGASNGALRGRGLAIAGMVTSFFTAIFSIALLSSLAVPLLSKQFQKQTLADARAGFKTQLSRVKKAGFAVAEPPAGSGLRLVSYPAALGEFPAYLSTIPDDGKKHPAIIWLVGGFSNSIGDNAWDEAPADNDQSARTFRENGVVTLYPSLRGGNENPGSHESFFGEVDDVLAAADWLEKQPGIGRIYLGGHSTGGTLALLTAETRSRFRAVFAFGPVDRVSGYGPENLTYTSLHYREEMVREPIRWLRGIQCPTYIIEGDDGNIESLREMKAANKNPLVEFVEIKGADHFSVIRPYSRQIATAILADDPAAPRFVLRTDR